MGRCFRAMLVICEHIYNMELTMRTIILLFMLFITVSSDVFTNSIVAGFPGAVEGRDATTYGVVLQGIFMVVLFMGASLLVSADIL